MSLWSRFHEGLKRTREVVTRGLETALTRRGPVDAAAREALEDALLAADAGPTAAESLIARAEHRMAREDTDLRAALEREATELLGARSLLFEPREGEGVAGSPWVALIVGVNGVGKTTLAGKLAAHFARAGRKTLLIAADTFRAAAAEQLEVWAARAGVEIVRGGSGADPAAVVHDGLTAALSRGAQVALIDTAGRLHTRQNLMAELEKMRRVCASVVPGAPHHVLLVLDATLGQNGLAQAREFQRAVAVTSLAINKLDGSARGGALLAIAGELAIPVSVVGLGEALEDWQPFDPAAYARGLFE